MTRALLDLPVFRRRKLATALESGGLGPPFTAMSVRSALGISEDAPELIAALREWEGLGVSGRAAAAWLRSLEEAEGRRATADFVWSGPDVPGVLARRTGMVFEEALGSARRSVWLSTYVYYDGPRAFGALARRMEAVPELEVTLVLNIERKRGDTTVAEDLIRRFADRFWKRDWPGTRNPRVFYDPRSLHEGGADGVLHAKSLVVDEERVLITSANLTEAALDRNIEMGVLLHDRTIAQTVTKHFQGLISRGRLLPVPGA